MQPHVYPSPRQPSSCPSHKQFVEQKQSLRPQLSWEQRASPILWPFVSFGLLQLAGRIGVAFVTGEPLIKFPLHPWPAAGVPAGRWCCWLWLWRGLSDGWHWAGLQLCFFFLVIEAFLMILAWHHRAWCADDVTSCETWSREKAAKACKFSTWHVLSLCSLKSVRFAFISNQCFILYEQGSFAAVILFHDALHFLVFYSWNVNVSHL